MVARFYHAAFVEYSNGGRPAHGGEAMGNDEGGAVLREAIQGFLNECFGFDVNRGCGFVEDEDGGVFKQCAGYGEALFFTAG